MKKLIDFFTEPLVELLARQSTPNGDLDCVQIESVVEPNPYNQNSLIYRPISFKDYIGQNKAKNILQSYIKATKERNTNIPHILIHGKAGCGKTTLAKIVANESQNKFIERITSTITTANDLISLINEADGGIIFLDELHGLERGIAESLYSIMEDFKYNGLPIKPFTFIGATTELGELLKNRKPFVDRFKIIIELEDYNTKDLMVMAKQYKGAMFASEWVEESDYELISKNSRLTPRTCIRLTEATIYLKDVKQVLNNFDVIKDGYTHKDLKVLRYVSFNEKGVGLQGLVAYLDTSDKNYIYNIEPFLLKNGLIIRTPRGRKITEAGKLKIIELEKLI